MHAPKIFFKKSQTFFTTVILRSVFLLRLCGIVRALKLLVLIIMYYDNFVLVDLISCDFKKNFWIRWGHNIKFAAEFGSFR